MGHFYASLPLCDNGKREHMHACEAPPRFLHRGKEKSISIVAFPSPSSVPPASHGATPEITSCSYMASRVAKQSRQNKMVLEFSRWLHSVDRRATVWNPPLVTDGYSSVH
mmetsp:Transcript_25786/g.46611  ORF Transcript_25786/g.46611 Transcript_25786/m.46611 type:complete len:110 (+) Transcript_25786:745-1074(+)